MLRVSTNKDRKNIRGQLVLKVKKIYTYLDTEKILIRYILGIRRNISEFS